MKLRKIFLASFFLIALTISASASVTPTSPADGDSVPVKDMQNRADYTFEVDHEALDNNSFTDVEFFIVPEPIQDGRPELHMGAVTVDPTQGVSEATFSVQHDDIIAEVVDPASYNVSEDTFNIVALGIKESGSETIIHDSTTFTLDKKAPVMENFEFRTPSENGVFRPSDGYGFMMTLDEQRYDIGAVRESVKITTEGGETITDTLESDSLIFTQPGHTADWMPDNNLFTGFTSELESQDDLPAKFEITLVANNGLEETYTYDLSDQTEWGEWSSISEVIDTEEEFEYMASESSKVTTGDVSEGTYKSTTFTADRLRGMEVNVSGTANLTVMVEGTDDDGSEVQKEVTFELQDGMNEVYASDSKAPIDSQFPVNGNWSFEISGDAQVESLEIIGAKDTVIAEGVEDSNRNFLTGNFFGSMPDVVGGFNNFVGGVTNGIDNVVGGVTNFFNNITSSFTGLF